MHDFVEGDEVLILLTDGNNKLKAKRKGPFKVKIKINDVNYIIELEEHKKEKNTN